MRVTSDAPIVIAEELQSNLEHGGSTGSEKMAIYSVWIGEKLGSIPRGLTFSKKSELD